MDEEPSDKNSTVAVPMELVGRIFAALIRHRVGHAPMRVPVDPTDSDIVQAELEKVVKNAATVPELGTLPKEGSEEWLAMDFMGQLADEFNMTLGASMADVIAEARKRLCAVSARSFTPTPVGLDALKMARAALDRCPYDQFWAYHIEVSDARSSLDMLIADATGTPFSASGKLP